MSRPYVAVLFDLDGVLIDTETVIGALWADIFRGQGLDLSAQEITRLTSGQRFEGVLEALETGRGWKAPEDFLPLLDTRFNAAFDEVPRIPGSRDTLLALQSAGVPYAIASNSAASRLRLKLDGADLSDLTPYAYDPSCVGGRGKPQPDLYLYAAAQLGVPIAGCIVIEDSLPGARAGVAAGATVWALLAGGHILPGDEAAMLEVGAAQVLHSHEALRTALGVGGPES